MVSARTRLHLPQWNRIWDVARGLINPRRACAARVTVLGLRVSWGRSVKGEKGNERKGSKVEVGREI